MPQDGPGIPVGLDQLEGTRKTCGESYLTYELCKILVSCAVQAKEAAGRNNEGEGPLHSARTVQTSFALKEFVVPGNSKLRK